MHSRRALMVGAVGLMASTAGCTDLVGDENNALLDIAVENLADEEQTAQIVIEDDDGEDVYSDVFDVEVSDDEFSVFLQDVVETQDGAELTARAVLPDHGTNEAYDFTVDCSDETVEDGVVNNDRVAIVIRSSDEIDFSHTGCS